MMKLQNPSATESPAECETAEEKGEAYLSDSWGGVDTLKIHKLDAKGKEHGFGDWTVGKYVELFNHDDEGYGLFVKSTRRLSLKLM